MNSKWAKAGLIITPQKNLWWMQTHAMVPTADRIDGSLYRVYFSGRDKENRSHIGYAIVYLDKKAKVLEYCAEPVLTLGELGCFDDNGVTPSWIVTHDKRKYLYYIGWQPKSTVRMGLIAGLAIGDERGNGFVRQSRAPVLERTDREPFSILTGPCVMFDAGRWKMWYVSCVGWVNKELPRYNIKYAESSDGIRWERQGTVCIDFKSDRENALARPCVLKEGGIYKMWFSYKGDDYRMGYAESKDGISWVRKDEEVGIDVSSSGMDSAMLEYAYVVSHNGKKYMFYNGNNYGKDGIGYAVCE